MKKFLALILALVMVFSLAGVAFAEDVAGNNVDTSTGAGTENNDVVVKVTASAKVYYVEINWEPLEFTYSGEAKWEPTSHSYDRTGLGFTDDEAVITVINHSNAPIWSTAKLENVDTTSGFSATLDVTELDLVSADTDGYINTANAPAKTHTVTVNGEPTDAFLADVAAGLTPSVTIGKVTVTISATDPTP